ncbi:hypothetical protein [Microcella sp.]|uniref:hypothetical protein n=1 Tax=Microcella sp. TaxID=1913979 RepID=UPI00256CBAF7|nr:hypothetical protein [Microcella sp.]MBX9472875.1 hypothetical protein [Microcella sp.]
MILRLDSRRPIVWRSPRCLQLGVDPRLAVLDEVTEGDARLIDALTAGISRAGLSTLAAQAGVPPSRVDEVLRAVDPALERGGERVRAASRAPLAIVGHGDSAARVAGVLGEAGHPVAVGASITRVGGRRPAAAVLVSSHVVNPIEHQRWLRRDIAHLPIVFGEVALTVGPLVVPGVTACLTCIERQRAARDDAWSAVAAQLWGRTAPTETLARATEAAIETRRLLLRAADGWAVRLDVDTGERSEQVWLPSELCGCRGLSPRPEPALRRENGSEPARRAPTSAAAPTRARALAAHA